MTTKTHDDGDILPSLRIHPKASLVPEMPPDEYAAFLADVRVRGVRVPIEVQPGTNIVLDGRTRLRAIRDLGDEYPDGVGEVRIIQAQLSPGESPVAYMLRAAMTRRHLTAGQRAMLAVELETEFAKEAKERQRAAGKAKGGDTKSESAKAAKENRVVTKVSQPDHPPAPKARDQAAAAANVAPSYVTDAKRVQEKAPALAAKVKSGELTLPQAKAAIRKDEKRKELEERAEAAEAAREEQQATADGDSDTPVTPPEPQWRIITGEVAAGDKCPLLDVECDSVRLIFADPPYNIGFEYGHGYDDAQTDAAYLQWAGKWIAQCADLLAPDGSMWVLINHEYAASYEMLIRSAGLAPRAWVTWYESFGVNCANNFNRTSRRLLYFVRDADRFVFHAGAVNRPSDRQTKYNDARANPGGKVLDDVWFDVPRLVGSAAERIPDFPTQLPLALLRRVIACASDPGDLILDPFNGSGTTGEAAIQLGRRYLGVERNPAFADVARTRLTGAKRDPL